MASVVWIRTLNENTHSLQWIRTSQKKRNTANNKNYKHHIWSSVMLCVTQQNICVRNTHKRIQVPHFTNTHSPFTIRFSFGFLQMMNFKRIYSQYLRELFVKMTESCIRWINFNWVWQPLSCLWIQCRFNKYVNKLAVFCEFDSVARRKGYMIHWQHVSIPNRKLQFRMFTKHEKMCICFGRTTDFLMEYYDDESLKKMKINF